MKKHTHRSLTRAEEIALEEQIVTHQKLVDYIILEYPIDVIVNKYLDGIDDDANEIFIPQYQRDFVWDDKRQSKFIESLYLGLPIPFLFIADTGDDTGRAEILDGSQRIRTLANYIKQGFKLSGLKKLDKLNGTTFEQIPPARKLRFLRTNIKMIHLTDKADETTRKDLFERINTGSDTLKFMEVRRGIAQGKFLDFAQKCTQNPLFNKLAPISERLIARQEREEFILRFFAYYDQSEKFKHSVKDFLDEYLDKMNQSNFDEVSYLNRFEQMLALIDKTLPNGFTKTENAKSTPRVRFEALAVGARKALDIKPNLICDDISWLESDEFLKHTKSDASNSKPKLEARIKYVQDKFLGIK